MDGYGACAAVGFKGNPHFNHVITHPVPPHRRKKNSDVRWHKANGGVVKQAVACHREAPVGAELAAGIRSALFRESPPAGAPPSVTGEKNA